jgi:glucosamine--fructose-6-phosphate aminotransferase (isomerizing)
MCGIVGYVGQKTALPIVLDGLKRLEYRGYDSAGFALYRPEGFIIQRNAGPVDHLVQASLNLGKTENQGIAHTRWATHGAPTELNAHPHCAGRLVIVHNGIIENYAEIKASLTTKGKTFQSQTDTEVFAKLIDFNRESFERESPELTPEQILMKALEKSMTEVDGHYAILVMDQSIPGKIYGIQNGAPLVASILKDGCIIASDIQAIMPYHNEVCFLPKGKIFIASAHGLLAKDLVHEVIEWKADRVEKDGYESFMMKEIHEQASAISDTLLGRLPNLQTENFTWDQPSAHKILWKNVRRVNLVACGTSYHAALIAKYFFEKWAKIDCQIDIASEFRYRSPVFEPGTVVGVISQSGETADTLAALRLAQEAKVSTFAICNIPNSTIARECNLLYPTKAGPEIGVASTKAFTCQVAVLCALALDAAKLRGYPIDASLVDGLARLPHDLARILERSDTFVKIGEKLKDQRMVLFVGRGTMYPIALEGALKFKELTYLPSEGFAAGELKHGPIAYIDPKVSVICIAPKDEWYSKTISNLEEVRARGGQIIALGTEGDLTLCKVADVFIGLPEAMWSAQPILSVVPLQLLAYGCAKALGRNIDKPRNLAKSVTVE